jgi:apolipoprotein D and lipocalin family protein
MRIVFGILVYCAMMSSSYAITTAKNVDLSKYLGLWYEIARIPNSFQDFNKTSPCFNTTAEYKELKFNRISVTNTCHFFDGKNVVTEVGKAKAKVVDPLNNAKLSVNFVPLLKDILFLDSLFSGQYWILALGSTNSEGEYSWAVVGSPDSTKEKLVNAWILSRDPAFEYSADFETALKVLKKAGVQKEELIPSRR